MRIVGGDSKQETYVVTHTTSGIYILMKLNKFIDFSIKIKCCPDLNRVLVQNTEF